jgi:hypothetical protein
MYMITGEKEKNETETFRIHFVSLFPIENLHISSASS